MTTPELPEFAYNVQTRAARIGSQIILPVDGIRQTTSGLLIDRDGEASGERDGYVSGIGWMGERLDGPRVGIAAS